MNEQIDESFEALLRYMRDERGFDFTGYKRTTLMRRVRHRMDQVRCESYEDYLDLLQASADEFAALFNTILINVTTFFRDPPAWEFVKDEAIPALLAERSPNEPLRVWSAGCASGQEAYTLAMLLAEALGTDDFRQRVKIYATDIDEDALSEGRSASYDAKAVESVPPELLERYFEQSNGRYNFRKDLRRAVIFGRNDLVKDAPISRVDLLACRNTLMYMNADTQRNVLGRLHFALSPRGALFLGSAEMLLSHSDRFTPMDLKHRVFRKTEGSQNGIEHLNNGSAKYQRAGDETALSPVQELAFRAGPVAQIVVTGDDTVAMINQQAESAFGLSTRDIGRRLRDLEVSYRPVELRAHVEQARVERRSARVQDVQWLRPGADPIWFEIHVNPLIDSENELLGVSIVFFDVTSTRVLFDKVVDTNRQLESMNEELQSTNDELHAINDALGERSIELEEAKGFADSLVNSIHYGMVIVDREMRIIVWNRGCEDLWGLRSDEVTGQSLVSLDIGLPLDDIKPLLGKAFVDPESTAETVIDAVNRRGRAAKVRVMCTGFRSPNGSASGAMLLMEVQP